MDEGKRLADPSFEPTDEDLQGIANVRYLRFENEAPADRTRFDNKSWRALEETIGAELVGFNLPEPAASWARGYANN